MKTVTEHLRLHLLEQAGLIEPKRTPDLEELRLTEWCPEFEEALRARLIVGAFRYGLLADSHKRSGVGRVPSAIVRLDRYQIDGNLEWLVDAANLCLCEFIRQRQLGAVLIATDDTDLHWTG